MLSSTLARTSRIAVVRTQRRNAGAFPASMAVKKNKYIEEWNGKREITEKTFSMDYGDVPTFVMTILVIPYAIYTWSRSELLNSGDRRYEKLV